MIQRPEYIDWLSSWRDKDVIKVITGMRRTGKSTVLQLFQEELKRQGVAQENIVSINFEALDEDYPRESEALYSYIASHLGSGKNYVFLDEIQHVINFETVVDGLYVRANVDVYITGSNAFFLSGELATLLTGRYVEKQVMPFSFKEYVHARRAQEANSNNNTSKETHIEALFNDYLNYGGLPLLPSLMGNEALVHDYLTGVFSTIITVDIAQRAPQMNMRLVLDTASFLADNIGNISSLKSISNALKDSGRAISPTALSDYIQLLSNNFLLHKVKRFDIKGKDYLASLEKYYLADLGMRFWLSRKTQDDVGRRIENVIYLELVRRYSSVAVGKIGRTEVDFVARRSNELHYYQVSLSILSEETRARELAPLVSIRDNNQKMLLTLDRIGLGNIDGIQHINIIDWLLQGE